MSKLDETRQSAFEVIDTLTTEQLETLLPTLNEGKDMNLILHIMEVIARREAESPTGKIRDVDAAWADFQANYKDKLSELAEEAAITMEDMPQQDEETEKKPEPTPKKKRRFPMPVRVAASVAVVFFAANLFTFSVFGTTLFHMAARWNDEQFTFGDAPLLSYRDMDFDSSTLMLINRLDSPHPFIPYDIPEEFTLFDCFMSEESFENTLTITFIRDDNMVFTIMATEYLDGATSGYVMEKDTGNILLVEEGGIVHYVFTNIDTTTAAWTIDNYEYHIFAPVTVEEMQDIIASIYNKK